MLSNACPKIKPGELTRGEAKAQKIAAEKAAEDACYRKVDARDGGRCRVCYRRVSPQAMTLLHRTIRHHMVRRSQTSDPHRTANVVSLCKLCDEAIHITAELHVEGNADQKDPFSGKLNGVAIYRATAAGWKLDSWR